MKEKLVGESRTIMTEMIMPNDTNPLGNLMGGNLIRWMDIAGGICAAKHCESNVVTASVDHVSFKNPIRLGDVITINAVVTRAFNSSVEVYVEVLAADITGANGRQSNHAYLSFVALDSETKRPNKVPPLRPVSSEEQKLFEGASRRRELRLILSGRMKPGDAKEIKDFFANT
jgi:acyl-CoA hydrolase